jgi:hypothetical protein
MYFYYIHPKEGGREGDARGNLTNVQLKAIRNCPNKYPSVQ